MTSANKGAVGRSAESPPVETMPGTEITTELIHRHVKRAHALRAQAVDAMLRRVASWLAGPFRRPGKRQAAGPVSGHDPYAQAEIDLKTPLASMRSAAEILRDNQDLPIDERNRFLDAVLQDNERLEEAVDHILHALDTGQGRIEKPAA